MLYKETRFIHREVQWHFPKEVLFSRKKMKKVNSNLKVFQRNNLICLTICTLTTEADVARGSASVKLYATNYLY